MKIKIKITLLMLTAVVISVGVLSLVFAIATRAHLQKEVVKKFSAEAIHVLNKLDRVLFERVADIKALTSKKNIMLSSDEFDINKKLDYLRQIEREYKVYISMSIMNIDGIVIGDTRGVSIGNDERDKPYFKEPIKGNIYSDKRPIFSESLGIPVIHFSGPLRDKNGDIEGVLVARFPINKIFEVVREVGGGIAVDLLDRDGLVLFSNHKRGDILRRRLSGLDIFKKVSKSEEETESLIGMYEGKEVLFVGAKEQGYLDYKGNDWVLVLGIDTKVALAPVNDLMAKILVSVLVVLLMAILLSLFISRSISKPIIKLKDAAIEIGKGKLDIKIEINSKDEIGELTKAFNRMAEGLKRSKDELMLAKAYTDSIISNMLDTLIVVDPGGKIRTVNKATLDLLGYKEEELIGKDISLMFTEEEEEEEEEELLFKGKRLEKLIKEGSVRDFDMTYKTKNGEEIPVSFTGSVMRQVNCPNHDMPIDECPEFKKKGVHCEKTVGVVGVAHDMRQAKKLIAELKKSKIELEGFSKNLERKIEERTKDLTQSQEATLNMMEDLQGTYNKLKETQTQLIHAEKMEAVGRMASGVAHEVKNPLGIILQGINYFEGTIPSTQKDKRELLQIMRSSIDRADKIVRALLDFSRSEELKMKPEVINSLIESSLGLVEHKLRIKNIKVSQEFEKDIHEIMADRGRIEQVFVNLFVNAIDAMPKGGELHVRSYLTKFNKPGSAVGNRESDNFKLGEEAVIIEVEDTGLGMDEDIKKKLFDPFFTTKDRAEGTGLGLSVAKSIIDMHRGLINVESEKGKGTKFTIVFKLSGRG
ncbi:ATP-binding protein [Candidatus Omnitrophota bacterium]